MIITIDDGKLTKNGYSNTDIKRIRDTCLATKEDLIEQKFTVTCNWMEKFLNTTGLHLGSLAKQNKFPTRIGSIYNKCYDIRDVLKFFWKVLHSIDATDDLKKAKIEKVQIENKLLLNKYIERKEAEERTCTLLQAIKNMFVYIVKASAPLMVGCHNTKVAEDILTSKYKMLFKQLDSESKKMDWEKENED